MSTITIAALLCFNGYPHNIDDPDSIDYALHVADLPHGGGIAQGDKYEVTTLLTVPEDSAEASAARNNSALKLNDTVAMDAIANELAVPSWSPDTIEWVAEIVVATGRSFACEDEDDDE